VKKNASVRICSPAIAQAPTAADMAGKPARR
jgi:hypothetical protein